MSSRQTGNEGRAWAPGSVHRRPLGGLVADRRGGALVEYIFLLGLVFVIGALAWPKFGDASNNKVVRQAECGLLNADCGGPPSGAAQGNAPAAVAPGGGLQAKLDALAAKLPDGATPSDGGGFWNGVGNFLSDAWGVTKSVGKGFFVDGLWGTVTGIWQVVTHPIDTVQGLWSAVTHPVQTFNAVKDSLVNAWNEDPARLIGAGLFEVVTAPIAALKATKLVKATKVIDKLDDVTDVVKIVDKVDDASDAAKAAKLAALARDFKTTPLGRAYVGENLPGNRVHGGGWLVEYLDDAGRASRKVTVKDGKLYDASGNLFDTTTAQTAHTGGGRAIFVMDEQGNIFVSTYQEVGRFHHSSLAGGKPVTGAGELVVENGVVKTISNKSGHYQPTAEMNEQVIKALEAQGVDGTRIVRDNWGG
ncbi:MAG: hypothetical protein WKG00_37990 [Polyangiaceae bacterium]